jgi:hypothetical protein
MAAPLMCVDCSVQSEHPMFASEEEYLQHRHKRHGEPLPAKPQPQTPTPQE